MSNLACKKKVSAFHILRTITFMVLLTLVLALDRISDLDNPQHIEIWDWAELNNQCGVV